MIIFCDNAITDYHNHITVRTEVFTTGTQRYEHVNNQFVQRAVHQVKVYKLKPAGIIKQNVRRVCALCA